MTTDETANEERNQTKIGALNYAVQQAYAQAGDEQNYYNLPPHSAAYFAQASGYCSVTFTLLRVLAGSITSSIKNGYPISVGSLGRVGGCSEAGSRRKPASGDCATAARSAPYLHRAEHER
jgi:hypothetical protein